MITKALYVPDNGVIVTFKGSTQGITFLIPEGWTIAAIENHLRELRDWLAE